MYDDLLKFWMYFEEPRNLLMDWMWDVREGRVKHDQTFSPQQLAGWSWHYKAGEAAGRSGFCVQRSSDLDTLSLGYLSSSSGMLSGRVDGCARMECRREMWAGDINTRAIACQWCIHPQAALMRSSERKYRQRRDEA